jgi:hypothetical protein
MVDGGGTRKKLGRHLPLDQKRKRAERGTRHQLGAAPGQLSSIRLPSAALCDPRRRQRETCAAELGEGVLEAVGAHSPGCKGATSLDGPPHPLRGRERLRLGLVNDRDQLEV